MKTSQRPGVVFQPDVHAAIQQGINQIVDAVKPTLGPLANVVAIDYLNKTNTRPEMLDSGGVIARRIIELRDRDENMGAMLARSMLLRQYEDVGDGTATAAVLFQAIYNAGMRYLAAGANAMRLRYYLEEALPLILAELDRMTFHIEGQTALTGVAQSLCHDPEMAELLGEIFEMIGEFGQLDIRKGQGRGLKREYIEGVYYNTGVFSRDMLEGTGSTRTEYQNPVIFLCDFEVDEPRDLFPVLKLAADASVPGLVIVLRQMTDRAMSVILANKRLETLKAVAVKLPGMNADDRMAALQDLSILTGATPMLKGTGDTLENVTPQHFGQARRVWVEQRHFGIIGGRGNPRMLREHIARLEAHYTRADTEQRQRLQERIGRLMGGSATLWVGGATEPEIEVRKALADRTALALRSTVRDGVVPGGGLALRQCRSLLEARLEAAADTDERAAYRILLDALDAPVRVIFTNAGFDAGEILAQISLANGTGSCVFDVMARQMVDVVEAGILDSALVQKTAVRNAISTAALALTIDTLVHLRKPEVARG
jgi:chaperonin GroEL